MRQKYSISGFTLIELLVTITIVGIVFGFLVTSASSVRQRSRDAQRQSDLQNIKSALQQYYSDQNFYPSYNPPAGGTRFDLTQDLTNRVGYFSATLPTGKNYLAPVPKDPTIGTTTPYCYRSFSDSTLANGNCTNALASECHYYLLCANVEGVGNTSTQCQSACGVGYDYQVTP